MHKYQLSNGPLLWPNSCASCGAPPTTVARASCSVVSGVGYYFLFARTTHLRAAVTYPVCRRHFWIARIAGLVSARNLFNLALGVAWSFSALGLAACLYMWLLGEKNPNPEALSWFGAVFVMGLAVYFLARRFTPVRLNGATKDTVTLSIVSETYAQKFVQLNAAQIISDQAPNEAALKNGKFFFLLKNPFLCMLILLQIGVYAAMIIPTFSGGEISQQNWQGLVLWSGITFAFIWKRRGLNGWKGFFTGIVMGALIGGLPAGFNEYLKKSQNRQDVQKAVFIDSCTGKGDATKRAFCTCVGASFRSDYSAEYVKTNIVPNCKQQYYP